MKQQIAGIFALFTTLSLLPLSCSTTALGGRSQLNLIPQSQINAMSKNEYNKFLRNSRLSRNRSQTAMIKRVGKRLKNAVEIYLQNKGLHKELKNFSWEFNLVQNKQVNAWCMPGGKIVFYTGILPYTRNDTGVAVVMGHEIAHAVLKHGNERMSQGLLAQMGGVALAVAVRDKPKKTQQLYLAAFGAGATVGLLLPYSRLHEYEADELGLIIMSIAGYKPGSAVQFWQRMSKKSGTRPPEFLSTHPSDKKRIKHLKKMEPKAMKHYKNKI